MIDEEAIRTRYAAIKDRLDERGRRLFVAAEKAAAGNTALGRKPKVRSPESHRAKQTLGGANGAHAWCLR